MSLATLADLLLAGARTAQAYCACGRIETLDLPALAAAHGATTIFIDIRARLRCSGCGSRGQATTTIDYPFASGLGQVSNHGASK
ncbi:MAG: hypothetical protein ACK5U4_01225 [Rhodospirillales bacterium]